MKIETESYVGIECGSKKYRYWCGCGKPCWLNSRICDMLECNTSEESRDYSTDYTMVVRGRVGDDWTGRAELCRDRDDYHVVKNTCLTGTIVDELLMRIMSVVDEKSMPGGDRLFTFDLSRRISDGIVACIRHSVGNDIMFREFMSGGPIPGRILVVPTCFANERGIVRVGHGERPESAPYRISAKDVDVRGSVVVNVEAVQAMMQDEAGSSIHVARHHSEPV